jgi:hypothetical protein
LIVASRHGKIDTVAAMNKSLARNNKSQDRGQSAPAGDGGGALLLLPLNTSPAPNADAPPSWPDFPIRGRTGMNPSHHGSDEQMFGAAQQVLHRGLVA